MLLQLRSAHFCYADVTIFKDVNLDVNEGDCVGIVGANGAGKSTLLNCIAGDAELSDGSVIRRNGLTMGYLRQNCDFSSQNTLFDEMMSVFARQTALIEEIKSVSEELSHAEGKEYRSLSERYHRLCSEADASEAYSCEVKVKTVLNGMGMGQFSSRIVATLSGGEKTKAALCKLLLLRPELMILDEPTNHLDYKTLDWLEGFLADKKSTLLIVSHDRYFLDKLCTVIWDVSFGSVTAYPGNYTKYKTLKAERQKTQLAAFQKQQREIARLNDYIARNKVRASTADMAKSREKALERMDVVQAPVAEERPPRFEFRCGTDPSEFPLTVQHLTLAFDGKTLLRDGNLRLRRGQKTALLGLNGEGKSTFIKRIADPDPMDLGKIVFGKNVRMGYYDQENLNLDMNLRVIDQLWFDNTRMSQTEVRGLLAQVGLGANDVFKPVSALSGGERAKLGLALIMAKERNFLLLDEPTNHLDLPSREALEQALNSYSGTLLFVSHDRYFVNSVCDSVAELSDGELTLSNGNYDDFISRKKAPEQPRLQSKPTTYRNAKQRAEQTNHARLVKDAEALVTNLENQLQRLGEQLSDPQIVCDYIKAAELSHQLELIQAELDKAIAEWEKLV